MPDLLRRFRRRRVVLVDESAYRDLLARAVLADAYKVVEQAQDAWLNLDTKERP
jgi:hypothetical protein